MDLAVALERVGFVVTLFPTCARLERDHDGERRVIIVEHQAIIPKLKLWVFLAAASVTPEELAAALDLSRRRSGERRIHLHDDGPASELREKA
jgi:hypothetical protein